MKKVDMIVKAPHFYTMDGSGVGYKSGVAMLIDAGKIVAFVDNDTVDREYSAEENIELPHHAVFPGFIDAHMHTSLNILRGLAQDTNYWMMYGLGPFSNVVTPEASLAGSKVAIIEAIRAGTTTLGDFGMGMDPICQFIDKLGARGHITHTVREARRRVYNPGELYEYDESLGEVSLQENLDLFERWHNKVDGRIKVLLGPQGPDFVSEEMLLRYICAPFFPHYEPMGSGLSATDRADKY